MRPLTSDRIFTAEPKNMYPCVRPPCFIGVHPCERVHVGRWVARADTQAGRGTAVAQETDEAARERKQTNKHGYRQSRGRRAEGGRRVCGRHRPTQKTHVKKHHSDERSRDTAKLEWKLPPEARAKKTLSMVVRTGTARTSEKGQEIASGLYRKQLHRYILTRLRPEARS